jgi:hypothetical protein
MPPRRLSRYSFAYAVQDADGDLVLYGEEPFRFKAFPDNAEHVTKQGETLFSLAGKYFESLPRPCGLWWVIADFQPEPIHDPTLELEVGRVLIIPSIRTLTEEIFAERRRLVS